MTVLPCYVAVDTSDSMAGEPLDAANAQLARLWEAIGDEPRLAPTCRLALVTFDAEARVDIPLSAVDAARPPRLAATRPATDYSAAFTLLRNLVIDDLAALRSDGLQPSRPAVALLTDGRPTRGAWPPAHAALTDPGWPDAPTVTAFGFGDAAEFVVRRIGTAGAHPPATVLATVMSSLLQAADAAIAVRETA